MKKVDTISKIFLYVATLTGSLWLGSYLTRLIISYRLFEDTDFILRDFLNEQNLNAVMIIIGSAVTLSSILYIVFIISFTLFLVLSKINLKENGWLFISTVLIYITLPFEIILMLKDYKLIMLVNDFNFSSQQAVNLIVERFKILGSFPIIELFCYFAVVYLITFKPFTKKNYNET